MTLPPCYYCPNESVGGVAGHGITSARPVCLSCLDDWALEAGSDLPLAEHEAKYVEFRFMVGLPVMNPDDLHSLVTLARTYTPYDPKKWER